MNILPAVVGSFALLSATSTMAAPVGNAKEAVKIACVSIRGHMAGDDGDSCDDFAAVLRGDVWTVSQKKAPQTEIGGGAPVVEISRETGEILNFYLSQ